MFADMSWVLWVMFMMTTVLAVPLYSLQRIDEDPDVVMQKMVALCSKSIGSNTMVDSLVAQLCANIRM
ncbi:unnamed protein product [Bursaphelenchus okinawaensis]|uniref:Uncharacterized protein n=1 Tax=Bursaphelenchus okinawaensis TaxID=465554 RepID=A0A811K905_9BILA|nr:unnamed protein product [Bursaphelenchus okinawaensis]CAG9094785.1 unnamed protein product [Bursaphelenchus okinawaensis]